MSRLEPKLLPLALLLMAVVVVGAVLRWSRSHLDTHLVSKF
jgi:hypothetical protein